MKKNKTLIYIIEIVTFVCIIMLYKLLSHNMFNRVIGIYFTVLTIIMLIRFGFMRDNKYIKSSVIRIVLASLMAYFIVIYALGLVTGFSKGLSSFTKDIILNGILFDLLLIISQEIIRYIICKNGQKDIKPIAIYTIILIIVSIIMHINAYNFSNNEEIFIFISIVVIPAVAQHILCSYITQNASFIPSIIYRLVITLYVYFLPFIPDLGNYLTAVVSVFLPYIIYFFSRRIIKYSDKSEIYGKKLSYNIIRIPILIILTIIILLISGIFRYKMLAVMTDSMNPAFSRGDAIIYDKSKIDKLEEGSVIAYKKDKVVVTHRIIDIRVTDDKMIFITKGDANKNKDDYIVPKEDVLGEVVLVLKYLGYPTVWIRDTFK